MESHIFREYDIRGIPGKDFSIEEAVTIGKAFGSLVGPGAIVVGRDVRLTSTQLFRKLVEGLTSTGCDVIDLGVVPTPTFNFAFDKLKADGGVCITASHNPPEYNGFKFAAKDEITFSGEKIIELKDKVESNQFKSGSGKVSKKEIIPKYMESLEKAVKLDREVKVVVDCGNGTCSSILPKVLDSMGCDVIPLYCSPDGRFPNHLTDPSDEKNLLMLRKMVVEKEADLGIAVDNDGDRVGFVDDRGSMVSNDIAMIFLAEDFLAESGAKIIHDVKFSRAFIEFVKEKGGRPLMTRTGYPNITRRMAEEGAKIAGELSGHFYYLDRGFYSDGLYTGAKFIERLSKNSISLSNMLKPFKKYYATGEIRMKVPHEKIGMMVENLKKELKKSNYRIIDIDGIRIEFEDGWALVRSSHTEPVLSMRFEGKTKEKMEEIRDFVLEEIGLLR